MYDESTKSQRKKRSFFFFLLCAAHNTIPRRDTIMYAHILSLIPVHTLPPHNTSSPPQATCRKPTFSFARRSAHPSGHSEAPSKPTLQPSSLSMLPRQPWLRATWTQPLSTRCAWATCSRQAGTPSILRAMSAFSLEYLLKLLRSPSTASAVLDFKRLQHARRISCLGKLV